MGIRFAILILALLFGSFFFDLAAKVGQADEKQEIVSLDLGVMEIEIYRPQGWAYAQPAPASAAIFQQQAALDSQLLVVGILLLLVLLWSLSFLFKTTWAQYVFPRPSGSSVQNWILLIALGLVIAYAAISCLDLLGWFVTVVLVALNIGYPIFAIYLWIGSHSYHGGSGEKKGTYLNVPAYELGSEVNLYLLLGFDILILIARFAR